MMSEATRSPTLDDLQKRLETIDLIPSQEPLLVEISERFTRIEAAGIVTVSELRPALENAEVLSKLAADAGVGTDYLTLLKRALRGFFPKPKPLNGFDWLDQKLIERLAEAGVKNTDHFNAAPPTDAPRPASEAAKRDLGELAALCDLSRVQWVSPTFARVLVAAGYRSAESVANANPHTLHDELARANELHAFYKGKIGRRDIARLVDAASYAGWTAPRTEV